MPVVHEIIETSLSPQDTFAFIADFANSEVWDPGTVSSKPINGTSVGAGSSYDLVVKVGSNSAPMVYTIETYEPDSRVVLRGEGKTVIARDDIRFEPTADGGTRVDYTADIQLKGWMRLLTPFLGGAFKKLGDDARTGMTAALAERAERASAAGR